MKARAMQLTNSLLIILNILWDEELIEKVCAAVSCNVPFTEDEIAAAKEE